MVYDANGNPLTEIRSADGNSLVTAYDVNGNVVFTRRDYSQYVRESYCSTSISQMQGFAVFNGKIFQMRANSSTVENKFATIDVQTQTVLHNDIAIASNHGDSANFSTEYYDPSDDFPLLYVTTDQNPAIIRINRVTLNSSELIRSLWFPLSAGYYSAIALDEPDGVAYLIGYTRDNYLTDDNGNNKTIISKWDMTELTDNGNGTYTPRLISSFERPFIYVMQGLEYHDGLIWVASGYVNAHGYIYAIDPQTGIIVYTIDTETTTEVEGVSWISDNEMVVGYKGGIYEKFTFTDVT